MLTFLLILAAVVVVLAIAGTVFVILDGGAMAVFALVNNSLGVLFGLLGSILAALTGRNE